MYDAGAKMDSTNKHHKILNRLNFLLSNKLTNWTINYIVSNDHIIGWSNSAPPSNQDYAFNKNTKTKFSVLSITMS